VGRKELRDLSVITLPGPDQKVVATVLDRLDTVIQQTGQLISKLTRIKQGLMQDLLTRGIDEHGNIRSEETHKFKDSPLGRIPDVWDTTQLNQCVSPQRPYSLWNPDARIWIPWGNTGYQS
jgi:type I restriction enzyme S subunit